MALNKQIADLVAKRREIRQANQEPSEERPEGPSMAAGKRSRKALPKIIANVQIAPSPGLREDPAGSTLRRTCLPRSRVGSGSNPKGLRRRGRNRHAHLQLPQGQTLLRRQRRWRVSQNLGDLKEEPRDGGSVG